MLLIDKIAIATIIIAILGFTGCMIVLDMYLTRNKRDKAPKEFR